MRGRLCAVSAILAIGLVVCTGTSTLAAEVRLAVAANFLEPSRQLAAAFTRDTGTKVTISSGSSGAFFAQIRNGAPFDIFLSADQDRPRQLEEQGFAVKGSRFTYATGVLVLWSANPTRIPAHANDSDIANTLTDASINHIAIANPQTAPYGAAAQQTLQALNLWERVQPKLIRGEDVSQTFHFASAGGAELAFVPQSTLSSLQPNVQGSSWQVPARLHTSIRQDAVLLLPGDKNGDAKAFFTYLRTPAAQAVIRSLGYTVQTATESR